MKYTAIEIDKFAVAVSDDNHEGIVRYYDVREVKGEMLGKVDFFCGGSPCQGFSFSGKQLAFDDPRSVLFFEYVRLLNELREINPDMVDVGKRNDEERVRKHYYRNSWGQPDSGQLSDL